MSDESVDGVIVLHHRAEDTMSLPGTIHPDRIALSLPGDIGCTDFVRFLEAFSLHTRNLCVWVQIQELMAIAWQ